MNYINYIYVRGAARRSAERSARRDPARSKQHAREKALTGDSEERNAAPRRAARRDGARVGRDSRGRDGTSACRTSLSYVESRANQTWRFGRCLRCEHTVTSAAVAGASTRR